MNNNLQLRPKPKFGVSEDAEDEMLNYQELFRRSNMEPAAKVIRVKRQQSNENEDKKKKYSDIDLTQTTVMRPMIIERDVTSVPIQLPNCTGIAFPQAKHRGEQNDLEKITLPNVKKASLFAKQMYREGKLRTCSDLNNRTKISTNQACAPSSLLTGQGLGDVTGEREMQRIHDENIDRLKGMNEKEILEEKEKLLNTLDPKLIAFIRQKSKKIDDKSVPIPITRTVSAQNIEKTLNLPVEVDSRWAHMNNIEHEKLEWMKDVPKLSVQNEKMNDEGVPARFDFKGNLLSRTDDKPVTAALHHHGDEPDAAGYTLEELFHLSRSTVLQQRVIALQTLSNIIRQTHTGIYDRDLQLSLIPKLIESGIVFLIRWAMDEQIEIIYMTAIECLSNLIAPEKDEEILSQIMHWPCGYLQPLLTPSDIQLGEKKCESDLTDIEILEQDLIKCLFRMNVLKRFVYLLDRMKPLSPLTNRASVKHIFHILIRMARHSMTCANQIFEERQLMDFIVEEFIPEIAIPNDDNTKIYGYILPEALKLCRVLASHGSTLTLNLINRYDFAQRLRNHFVATNNLSSSLSDNHFLCELLLLWRVFILQGHMANEFGSLMPSVVFPLFRICIQQMPNSNICRILVHLIILFDALMIHITKFISKQRKASENSSIGIDWSHIDGIYDVILIIGKQALIETDEKMDVDALHTACLSCMATFLIGQRLLTINLIDLPSKVSQIRDELFEPILGLKSTKQLIERVKFETATLPTNSTRNLPTLTQTNISPFGFLIALLRLTNTIYQIDKTLPTSKQFISKIMLTKDSEVLVYIKKIIKKFTSSTEISWFEQFEHIFLYQFIHAIHQEKLNNELPSVYYEILFSLLSSILKGHHFLAQEILKFVFMDLSFWKRSEENDLADLSLITNETLSLASNESIKISSSHRTQLYERAVEHLPALYTYYKNILHINRTHTTDFNIQDIHFGYLLLQNEDYNQLNLHYSCRLMDVTWPYGFLSSLYTDVIKVEENNKKFEIILNSLRFIYILEMKHNLYLCKRITPITRYSMIAGIYLLGSDIFLDKDIADYLIAFLNCFNQQHLLQKLEIKSSIQSLMNFYDFYRLLIDQYDACSFGDVLFSNYLLAPLQQIYDVQLRKLVWIEHSTILKYLRLKPDQLLISLEPLFIPHETDVELIRYYAQILLSGTIKSTVQPLLHMIAVHHLNGFLFDQTRNDQFNLQKAIFKSLQVISTNEHKTLYYEIINYKTFSRDGPVIFIHLPLIRSNWLEKLL